MKNVLLTGGTGFIGRNIKSYLNECCHLFCPDRHMLDLLNGDAVKEYIKDNQIDVVIHSANPNPVKNQLDRHESFFEDSIRIFLNLYEARKHYGMMYYFGSGAEYDKSKDISMITEADEFRSVPYDSYGIAKYLMNQIASKTSQLCNLRIFGCYGPTDHDSKFITHAIKCCLRNDDITIKQNCYFDYINVLDLGKILEYFIYNKPKYSSYNVCSGEKKSLYEIAEEVRSQMGTNNDIVILRGGMNNEYTASNNRLIEELCGYKFVSIEDGIAMQIQYEKGIAR